jgi:pimeloyl-ACP methyl ester carboxylesterase
MTEGWLEGDGGRVWYDVAGSGPAVMLLHPGGFDARVWEDQVGPFSERFTVVRTDIRGFGRSDRPRAPFSVIDDVEAVAGAAGFDRVALVGVSLGGSIAMEVAADRPFLVTALVPCACSLIGLERSAERRAFSEEEEALVAAGKLDDAIELGFRVWMPQMGRDPRTDARIRSIAFDNRDHLTLDDDLFIPPPVPAIDRLEAIRAPTLVVEAERDLPDMRSSAELIEARIPGTVRAVVPGTDHLLNMRNPGGFNEVVVGFLDSVLSWT